MSLFSSAGFTGVRPSQPGRILWLPAPLVEPLVNYYLATGDKESLAFAKAYAEGIMTGAQPDVKVTYQWLGNMVVSVDPPPAKTPLFLGKPRILPDYELFEPK
jgi:hypothetical protein